MRDVRAYVALVPLFLCLPVVSFSLLLALSLSLSFFLYALDDGSATHTRTRTQHTHARALASFLSLAIRSRKKSRLSVNCRGVQNGELESSSLFTFNVYIYPESVPLENQ